MGKYFSAKDTRQVVSNNFNAVRGLFRLSSPKLTELVQPITEIPYSKFRRLMSGERDITVEELNTLYELLAVPPTTFMLPWSIKLPSKRTGFFSKKETRVANPVFDCMGTPTFPYSIAGKENWLPAQFVGQALTKSDVLFTLERLEGDDRPYYFEDTLQKMLEEYTHNLFPTDQYIATLQALYDRYPAQQDGSLLINDVADFLMYFGHALLAYMRKEATLNLYQQLVRASKESMFVRCYGDRAFSTASAPWVDDDAPLGTLFQLVNYAGRTKFEIMVRISAFLGEKRYEQISITAKDSPNGNTLCSIDIPFNYQEWFAYMMPTTVTMSGLQGKTPTSSADGITIWEGEIWKELCDEESVQPFYRRFPYLYPVLTPTE